LHVDVDVVDDQYITIAPFTYVRKFQGAEWNDMQAGRYHRSTVEEAQRDSKLWKEQAERSIAVASEVLSKSVESLERYQRYSAEVQKQAILAKELEVAVQMTEETNKERVERHAAIDEVRRQHFSAVNSVLPGRSMQCNCYLITQVLHVSWAAHP
jgi:hypothetical protein